MSSRPSRGAARLAAILDALPDGLLLVNCNGTVVNANTIALEMFETPGTALVGRGLLDLLPEFDSRLIPGSMRRPDAADEQGRTKPTRMTARRTDGTEYPVEVTSAALDSGQAGYNDIHSSYTGDELLMLVVRDLSGTVDTEAELARSQRQTEMILRAASEGVVGTDTDGRVVLVNPAAAQILGFRASDLGGKELHPLILHSRAEGDPFPYEESPLADTLKSGRKHRVRGQVLWSKSGAQVPVDLTTAPVRDGDQLVGAVMTFTDRRPYEELTEQHTGEVSRLTERHAAEIAELTEAHSAEVTRLTEKHAAETADRTERYASELEEKTERLADLGERHTQLTAVLGESLRGPLEELRGELSTLAADPAGQLWPEANQILHHLAAGYARMTTLVDNVLSYQRLDSGSEELVKHPVLLDSVVTAGIDGAVELIGPGRAQFAVHAPPIEAEVDAGRLITALAHLVADVAGVDSTGKARLVPGGGYVDSTVVVAAAQRGDVVRIEVRGPFAGGDPVHVPIVRGIVRAHGGVLQTHEMPGMSGSAYVLEVPIGTGSGTIAPVPEPEAVPAPAPAPAPAPETVAEPAAAPVAEEPVVPEAAPQPAQGGRRRARRASTDAFLDSPLDPASASGDTAAAEPTGRRRARRETAAPQEQQEQQRELELTPPQRGEGSGRRRGRPSPAETGAAADQPRQALALPAAGQAPSEGSVVTAAEGAQGGGRPQLGQTVPPQGVPQNTARTGRQGGGQPALPALASSESQAEQPRQEQPAQQPGGRRARRALAAAQERAAAAETTGPRTAFALPPAAADRIPPVAPGSPVVAPSPVTPPVPVPAPGAAQPVAPDPQQAAPGPQPTDAGPGPQHVPASPQQIPAGPQQIPAGPQHLAAEGAPQHHAADDGSLPERHDAVRTAPDADHTPPQPHPLPSGRRRGRPADAPEPQAGPGHPVPGQPLPAVPPQPDWAQSGTSGQGLAALVHEDDVAPAGDESWTGPGSTTHTTGTAAPAGPSGPVPTPDAHPADADAHAPAPDARRQPLPAEAPMPASSDSTQGRAFSVRTLGQGVPFAQHLAHQQNQTLGGAGRRRKLASPPETERQTPAATAPVPPQPVTAPVPPQPGGTQGGTAQGSGSGRLMSAPASEGRSYAIGAPDEGAEGPEPLDGPGGAVEVANRPQPQPVDDELPPEPLDNPRRLLVWPAPDVSTQQALSDRGYRPVIVHSREEVDAQIAAFPAALFVDPLTGPITRTALQSLRQAAVAAEVPVLVTAGLGQATREAAYGADPAVLLKALAPRDSDQHPPRVLVIEEHEEIALALTETLERRGMQVARASGDTEAVDLATRMRPNLVVMDLMQVRRRRAGIIDWLRANGALNHTPLVVYTSAGMEEADLPMLASGETVLFLAERSTSDEVQSRIVDLLAKIGTN
ncbi:PAS domain-containing protein [Streptomyces sp. NBC_00059]|uniref:PAS domain-containing protein n=1 Tax=Streptomyces sp. NBC_00059 TaxID=2975635 RepID=UPI002250AC1B|nr:PAS domain-containing protein [Streptomyces sp. NBC_00059]MCX5411325.1 PAS domain-containing protein [Streptomyces sp. NBC_00059]